MSLPTRVLGHSGIEVTSLAFGTMMFGQWGNTDVDECHRMVGTCARRRHHAVRHGRHVRLRHVRDHPRRRRCAAAAIRSCWPPRCGNPMGGDPAAQRPVEALDRAVVRRQPASPAASTTSTCTRCTDPIRRPPSTRRSAAFDDLVTSGKVRADRHVDVLAAAARPDRRAGHRARRAPGPPASSRRTRCSPAASRPTVLPACRRHDLGVLVWAPLNGGWLTGKYQGAVDDSASRALRQPDHFDHGKDAIRVPEAGHGRSAHRGRRRRRPHAEAARARLRARRSDHHRGASSARARSSSSTTCSPPPTCPSVSCCPMSCAPRSTPSSRPA